jgi:hypothetical protein
MRYPEVQEAQLSSTTQQEQDINKSAKDMTIEISGKGIEMSIKNVKSMTLTTVAGLTAANFDSKHGRKPIDVHSILSKLHTIHYDQAMSSQEKESEAVKIIRGAAPAAEAVRTLAQANRLAVLVHKLTPKRPDIWVFAMSVFAPMFAMKVNKVCDEGGSFQRYIISPDEWVKCFREASTRM